MLPYRAVLTALIVTIASPASAQTRAEEAATHRKRARELDRERWSVEAETKRLQAIEAIKTALGHQREAEIEAQLLLRLAELQWEQGGAEHARAMDELHRAETQHLDLPDAERERTPAPTLNTRRADAWRTRAVETWRHLLGRRPSRDERDQALFSLAHGLAALQDPEAASTVYRRLVALSPRSPLAPDAHVAIAELLFEEGNAFGALTSYRRAAAFADAAIRPFALYKMGWCFYNLGRYDDAVDALEQVLRGDPEGEAMPMREDALRDLVVFFSEMGDLERAIETLSRYDDGPRLRRLLRRLATRYAERGETELAIDAYRTLIARRPHADDNPENQAGIVAQLRSRDDWEGASEAIDRLVETYGTDSSWAHAQADRRPVEAADAVAERTLYSFAVDTHREAIKRRSARLLRRAEAAYARYLTLPSPRRAYTIRFRHAELLYKLQRYDEAADGYAATVAADPKGKHLRDAAINTIFAVEKAIEGRRDAWEREDRRARRSKLTADDAATKYARIPVRPGEQRLLDACDRFAELLPDDDRTLNVLYKAATLLAAHNEFRASNARYESIIAAEPRSERAQFAVHAVLDSYAKIEAWEELKRVARTFHDDPDVGVTDTFKAELWTIHERASFRAATALGDGDRPADAADAFEAFERDFPASRVRDIALYNAAHHHGEAGDRARALALRHRFVEEFPTPLGDDSEPLHLWPRSMSLLADHYRSVAWYDRAAELYRRLFDAAPDFDDDGFTAAADGLFLAAAMRDGLGDFEGAVTDWRDFLAHRPDDPEAVAVRLRVARALALDWRDDDAVAAYRDVHRDPAVRSGPLEPFLAAVVGHGRLLAKRDDGAARTRLYRDALRRFDPAEAGGVSRAEARLAAEMRFNVLEPQFAAYDAMHLERAGDLAIKSRRLEELQAEYLRVIELQEGEWGIAAMVRIGALYDDFADEILANECPPELTETQCAEYRFSKVDAAGGFVDEAVDAYQRAAGRSYELGLYTDWTAAARAGLEELRPEEFPARSEIVPSARPPVDSDADRKASFVE